MITPQNTLFMLLVLSALANIIAATRGPNAKCPSVCDRPPKKPKKILSDGYRVYYFNKREGKCKCFWSPDPSKTLGGNAFPDTKACRNRCGGGKPTLCVRRGKKV
ncbi:uncharacterized protein ISCGN_029424 [Ixodes scapularis]